MAMESLRKLYEDELKDLYSAERQILQALPKMVKKAGSEDLRRAFEEHLGITERHVERLDRIFEQLGRSGRGKKCKGMEGLLEEGRDIMDEDLEPNALDAGLIGAAQKVEHYEIAGYGTARSHAEVLGETEHARLLQQTLDEEGEADKKLTAIARSFINAEAAVGV